ncbi:MAG: O-methyltransferase [Gemmatimonadota bacterium]
MTDISDPRLAIYIRDRFAPEDEVLAAIARRAIETGVAPMQLTSEVGKMLHVLALAVGARRILEVGTLLGYSAIWMARALPIDGRLTTIEIDHHRAAEAREWIARAGVADRVEVKSGPALDVLPALASEARDGRAPYDFVFIDAAKQEYPAYLDWALELVRPGSVIAADNTLLGSAGSVVDAASATPALAAVKAFNERLATDARLISTIVPIREGVSISFVR